MRNYIVAGLLLLLSLSAWAQADRREVRAGNRKFRREAFREAEIDYRKAVLKDTNSVAAQYDLASALYREEDYAGAAKALDAVKDVAAVSPHGADYYYNRGDAAIQQQDWAGAVEAFKQSLLRRPDDLDAKENYLYAKKMLQDQQQNGGGGGGGSDQNQDQQNQDQQNQDQQQNRDQDQQNQDQNQQNQNQNNDQNQDQNQDQQQNPQNQPDQNQDQQGQQPQESKISPQQAQQMIQAIQAKEKETQDKVNKKKAALLKSRQREKNW